MNNGAFETILSNVDAHVSSAIASFTGSPSNLVECLPALEQAAQLMTGLSKSKPLFKTPEVSSLLSALAARISRAEALLENAAAFQMGCLNAHTGSTGGYSPANYESYSACLPALIKVEG